MIISGCCMVDEEPLNFFITAYNPVTDTSSVNFITEGCFSLELEDAEYILTVVFYRTEVIKIAVNTSMDITDWLQPYIEALNDPQVKRPQIVEGYLVKEGLVDYRETMY